MGAAASYPGARRLPRVARHAEQRGGQYCAQMQSSGAIAQASPAAILDLQTTRQILADFPVSGVAMDFCAYDSFTSPTDIRPLVASVTGFNVTSTNVPTTGLTSTEIKQEVIELAVTFFGRVLNRGSDDDRPFEDCLSDRWKGQPEPEVKQQDLDDAEQHADDPD